MINVFIAGAALVGAISGALCALCKNFNLDSNEFERVAIDELSGGEVKSWFKENVSGSQQVGVLFSPTPENVKKFKFSMKLDKPDNTIIQVAYDDENNKIIALRVVEFNGLSEKLEAMLRENNGTVIVKP